MLVLQTKRGDRRPDWHGQNYVLFEIKDMYDIKRANVFFFSSKDFLCFCLGIRATEAKKQNKKNLPASLLLF